MGRKYTDARKENNRKWDAANLDRISLALPKGKKDIIKKAAENVKVSMNQYIEQAIDEKMERDAQKTDFEKAVDSIEEVGQRDPGDGLLVLPADWDSEEGRAEDEANEKKGAKPEDE